jgi:hypothetical protein
MLPDPSFRHRLAHFFHTAHEFWLRDDEWR